MKLRIKGDSIRMRLSQNEVNELASKGKVNDVINFGANHLMYQLAFAEINAMTVIYEDNLIHINISEEVGRAWTTSDQVGIQETIALKEANTLSVLIEKDFKCLTDRPNEDESDLFENPLNQHNC